MGNYTMTLWEYLNQGNPLFDFEYFIWDESQRERIQQMFADYYMYREICVDSPQYFHHMFKTRWKLHFPYFNELYKSAQLKYNPLTTRYEAETVDEDVGKKTEDIEAKLSTGHTDTRLSDSKTLHEEVVGTLDETKVGTEDEDTKRFLDEWEHTDEHERGTLDQTVDSTKDTDEVWHEDGDKDTTEDLKKDVVGHSDRVTDTTSDTHTTTNTSHSDYPQANIAAITPENPGQWVTWTEHGESDSHTDTHGTEKIDNTENTVQNITGHEEYRKDGTRNEDITANETTDQDTSRTLVKDVHHTEDEHTVRDLDTSDVTDQDTTQTTDLKSFENEIGKTDKTEQEAGSKKGKEKTKRSLTRTLSGYSDKSPQELLILYRQALINIDKQLVDTFSTLFMEVY